MKKKTKANPMNNADFAVSEFCPRCCKRRPVKIQPMPYARKHNSLRFRFTKKDVFERKCMCGYVHDYLKRDPKTGDTQYVHKLP